MVRTTTNETLKQQVEAKAAEYMTRLEYLKNTLKASAHTFPTQPAQQPATQHPVQNPPVQQTFPPTTNTNGSPFTATNCCPTSANTTTATNERACSIPPC